MSTTPDSVIAPSLIRTGSPFIIGLIGSWLTRQGLDINDDLLSALLVAVYGYGTYVVVRFLEVFADDRWGYVLGVKKAPVYGTAPARRTARPRGDAGRGVLGVIGIVLLAGGAIVAAAALLDVLAVDIVAALVVAAIGLVLVLVDGGGNRAGL